MHTPPRTVAAKTTPSKLLDAAEHLFARQGYEGTSIREITTAAGVRLALAHYHFASKEDLFRAVLARRAGVVNASRLNLLERFRSACGERPLSVEQIVRAYISPYVYLSLTGGPGWRDYSTLAARMLSSDAWVDLLCELFDDLAQAFLAELRRTFPDCAEEKIQWAFDFLVGSMASAFCKNNRIHRLSAGLCSSHDLEQACRHLIPFIASGVEAVASGGDTCFADDFEAIAQRLDAGNQG